jgi:Protein of unknown function (DUF1553)/Protein of unknown function (DUF1549)
MRAKKSLRSLTVLAGLFLLLSRDTRLRAGTQTSSEAPPGDPLRHWAFQPIRSVAPPRVEGAVPANPIDAFILVRLQNLGIQPAPQASPIEQLRRVTHDLAGLPPAPQDRHEFLKDPSASGWERLVDRLLSRPDFGERWAQHWLDLAHYADSNGFELDADRPDAWRYRDWVIRALNQDLPYDRFLTLQIAGDEAAPGDPDALIASGFGRAGPREVVAGNIDPEVRRQNELTEVVGSVGSVFLGLTVGCARCHDHKFDPITAEDYYGLEAYFAGTQLTETALHTDQEKTAYEKEREHIEARIKPLTEARNTLEEPYRTRLASAKEAALTPREREIRAMRKEDRTAEEQRLAEGIEVALDVKWEEIAEAVSMNPADHQRREALKHQIYQLELELPRPPARAMAMTGTTGTIPETHVLRRGNIKDKRQVVLPHPPSTLVAAMRGSPSSDGMVAANRDEATGRRLSLARWMTATNNPLVARVIVNRLWQHHFGRGLVATSSDFGVRGDRPTDPELLDWLAGELIRNGWHLKPIHRLMVTSDAYRRQSRVNDRSMDRDPSNQFWARMNRRRMDAEALRDSILAVSGRFNPKAGGPGVHLDLEPEVRSLIFTEQEVVELWPVDRDPAERNRRSVYVYRKRNVHYPLFDAFDAPDALTPCPVRPVSTHAPQALVLMNSRFSWDSARAFAESLKNTGETIEDRIRAAFERCFARPPTPPEMDKARRFIDGNPHGWTDFSLALMNSNEFAYVP